GGRDPPVLPRGLPVAGHEGQAVPAGRQRRPAPSRPSGPLDRASGGRVQRPAARRGSADPVRAGGLLMGRLVTLQQARILAAILIQASVIYEEMFKIS